MRKQLAFFREMESVLLKAWLKLIFQHQLRLQDFNFQKETFSVYITLRSRVCEITWNQACFQY